MSCEDVERAIAAATAMNIPADAAAMRRRLNASGFYLHLPGPCRMDFKYKVTGIFDFSVREEFEQDFDSLDEIEAWLKGVLYDRL